MANTNDPLGLTPAEGAGGSRGAQSHEYVISDSYTTAIGQGMIVSRAGGVAIRYAQGNTNILGATANFVSSSGTGRTVHVYDDPDQRFEIQVDDNTLTTLASFVGQAFEVTGVTLIDSVWKNSKLQVDGSSGAAAGALTTLHCVDVSGKVGNTLNTSWTKIIVQFAKQNHHYAKMTVQDVSA